MSNPAFVFVGTTGSGKTSLLTAMYDNMRRGCNSFSISASGNTAREMNAAINNLENPQNSIDRFPLATDDYSEYLFNLSYHNQNIYDFSVIDYPGGNLTSMICTQDELNEHINNCPTIFVCISAELFYSPGQMGILRKIGYTDDDRKVSERISSQAKAIRKQLESYIKNTKAKTTNICFVITKYDLIYNHFSEDRLKKIITSAFDMVFRTSEVIKKDVFISIIKVSLGLKISENKYKGRYQPYNVHLPILFGVFFSLMQKSLSEIKDIRKIKRGIAQVKDEIDKKQQCYSETKRLLENASFWDKGKIKKCCKAMERDMNNLVQEYKDLQNNNNQKALSVEKMEKDLKSIFAELDSSEQMLFKNGKQVRWNVLYDYYIE